MATCQRRSSVQGRCSSAEGVLLMSLTRVSDATAMRTAAPLRAVVRMDDDVLWVQAHGRLDAATAPAFVSLLAAVWEPCCVELRIDLSEVTSIVAAGVAELLRCRDEAERRSCVFAVELTRTAGGSGRGVR